MTRTKAFKDYIKKFYNIDAEGMTPTDVVQDFLMKQYGHDSTANSLTSAIVEMIDNDLAPSSGGQLKVKYKKALNTDEIKSLEKKTVTREITSVGTVYVAYAEIDDAHFEFEPGDISLMLSALPAAGWYECVGASSVNQEIAFGGDPQKMAGLFPRNGICLFVDGDKLCISAFKPGMPIDSPENAAASFDSEFDQLKKENDADFYITVIHGVYPEILESNS